MTDHEELLEEILQNADEHEDGGGEPAEVLAVRYVRKLEAKGEGWAKDHARRYLEAAYGKDVWFAAPETFNNTLERWIWAVASGVPELAETCMAAIEQHFAERRQS